MDIWKKFLELKNFFEKEGFNLELIDETEDQAIEVIKQSIKIIESNGKLAPIKGYPAGLRFCFLREKHNEEETIMFVFVVEPSGKSRGINPYFRNECLSRDLKKSTHKNWDISSIKKLIEEYMSR